MYDSDVWIGLTNPSGTPCEGELCQGVLKWDDGSDFLYNSNWISSRILLGIRDDGSGSCFYLSLTTGVTDIRQADCNQGEAFVLCQSNQRCPGKGHRGTEK